jgi:uncharacterized protein YrrD
MLYKAKTLNGFKLNNDGKEIGRVKEFYFDDQHWTIRYLVADTGNWLVGRQVLISPYALGAVMEEEQCIVVGLSRKQIEDSPSLDSDKPVSRQFEDVYHKYYGYPVYWEGPFMWGGYPGIVRDQTQWKKSVQTGKGWDPHLRSTQSVSGYHIQAMDGEIGHIDDFIIDEASWAIRYLVVDTKNWWHGKKVLVAPQWIERVSWDESKVYISLSVETIKKSPEYTAESLPTRDYEEQLHKHYERQAYWYGKPSATPEKNSRGGCR